MHRLLRAQCDPFHRRTFVSQSEPPHHFSISLSLVTPICRSTIRSTILARKKFLSVDQVSACRVVLGQLLGGRAQEFS